MGLFTTRQLLGYTEQKVKFRALFLELFFRRTITFHTQEVMLDKITGKTPVAAYVSPVVSGKVLRSRGGETRVLRPGYVKPKHRFDYQQAVERLPGEDPARLNDPAYRRLRILTDNLKQEEQAIVQVEEMQAVSAVLQGKYTMSGEQFETVEVDFGRSAANNITQAGGREWSQQNADTFDPTHDLDAYCDFASGTINIAIMDGTVWRMLNGFKLFREKLDTEGCVALPGAYGYGMTKSGGNSIVASDMTTVARATHNKRPGRYYTFSTQTEETTGITEIIWLDNNWGDKTSQTATKLVLFFGKDGRILMTIRGDDIYAPVTWTNLTPQLGSAAQKDVQEDIYDRTEGRLAIPGAFGYGAIFRSSKSFSSENGPTEFLEWVKNTNPGQYAVTQYGSVNRYNPIIKGVVFTGIVDIKIPDTVASNASPDNKGKVVTFYGVNGEIYYNRLAGSQFYGWVKLNLKGVDFADILSARTAPTSLGDPDIGGLILAAYQGTADRDTNISMTRGYAYPGSSLTPLSIAIPSDRENVATATPLITTRGCRGWSLPGAYIALNGAAGNVRGDSALVGLFVRAA